MLPPAAEEEPFTVPAEAPRAPATVPAEVFGVVTVEEVMLAPTVPALKASPPPRGPVEELRAVRGPAEEVMLAPTVPVLKVSPPPRGPAEEVRVELEELEEAGSGAGVSRSLWILSRAERFSSSRSWTVTL